MIIIRKNKDTLRQLKFSAFFGFLFALLSVVGRIVYETNSIAKIFDSFILFLLEFILVFGLSSVVIYILLTILNQPSKKQPKHHWKMFEHRSIFWCLWGIFFACLFVTFLAYYPGIFSYDSVWQTEQALSDSLSAITEFHPPIHTLFWKLCLSLGSVFGINGMAIYTILQLLFMSFVFAKIISFLIENNVNDWYILIAILFLALNPAISVFCVEMTKDVMFAAFFALVFIEVIKFVQDPEQYVHNYRNFIYFCSVTLFCCLFRNNMVYAFLLFAIIVFFAFKKNRKRILILLSLPVVCYILITGPLYSILGFGGGNVREMLCVPIQQIAYTVNKHADELPDDFLERVNSYLPIERVKNNYNYRLADLVKDYFNSEHFLADKMSFIKIWAKLLVLYPGDYISSFLTLNVPYWYPGASLIDQYSQRSYIETDMRGEKFGISRDSKIPFIFDTNESFIRMGWSRYFPLLASIFSLALPFWLSVILIFIMIYKRQQKFTVIGVLPLSLILTFLLGPVSIYRYIFPIVIIYPIILSLIFQSERFMPKRV